MPSSADSLMKRSFRVFALPSVIAVTLFAVLIANAYKLSGYWDDTILFVRLVDAAPSNPLDAIPWILNQQGDLNGPLILGILYCLKSVGILSNWFLVFLGNLVLGVLILLLMRLSVRLGYTPGTSLFAALVTYLAPVLIEQRSWFIAIQHSLTVLFSVAACFVTYEIIRSDRESRNIGGLHLAALNFLLILLGLARETALPLALIVIAVLLLYQPSHFRLVTISWMIPVVVQLHRLITGREGTHVRRLFLNLWYDRYSSWSPSSVEISPTWIVILCLLLLPFQIFIRNHRTPSTSAKDSRLLDGKRQTLTWIEPRLLLIGVWLLFLQDPKTGTPFVSLIPPLSSVGKESLVLGRWSQFGFDLPTYHFVTLVTLIVCWRVASRLTNLMLVVSVLLTAPYLAVNTGIVEAVSDSASNSLSRYSIYLLPAAYFVLLDVARHVRSTMALNRRKTVVILSIITIFWIIPEAQQLSQLSQTRSAQFSSYSLESCSTETYMVLSQQTTDFLANGYTQTFVSEPQLALLDDARLRSAFPNLQFAIVEQSDVLQYCFDDLSIESLIERLGTYTAGEVQLKLDDIRANVRAGDEGLIRAELRQILEKLITDGIIRQAT